MRYKENHVVPSADNRGPAKRCNVVSMFPELGITGLGKYEGEILEPNCNSQKCEAQTWQRDTSVWGFVLFLLFFVFLLWRQMGKDFLKFWKGNFIPLWLIFFNSTAEWRIIPSYLQLCLENIISLEIPLPSDNLRTQLLGIHSGKTRHTFGSSVSSNPTEDFVRIWPLRKPFLWTFSLQVSSEHSLKGLSLSFVSASSLKLVLVRGIMF